MGILALCLILLTWGFFSPFFFARYYEDRIKKLTASHEEEVERLTKAAELTEEERLRHQLPANLQAMLDSFQEVVAIHRALEKEFGWPADFNSHSTDLDAKEKLEEEKLEAALDEAVANGADEHIVTLYRTLRKIKEPSEEIAAKVAGDRAPTGLLPLGEIDDIPPSED